MLLDVNPAFCWAIVCTCVKDQVIDEKDDYKKIRLRGFDYKLFEEDEGRGKREGLDEYPYLKHLIQLWTGYWLIQMEKMNKAVCIKNCFTSNGGGKRPVKTFQKARVLEMYWLHLFVSQYIGMGGAGYVDYIHYSFEEILVAYGVDETEIR